MRSQKGNVICTIASANYIAFVLTLVKSLIESGNAEKIYCLLVDRFDPAEVAGLDGVEFVDVQDIGISNFKSMAFKFNVVELNTNVKPAFLKYLLQERGHDRVIYLDPDILVLQPISFLFDELANANILLTPHITEPVVKSGYPKESHFLLYGTYNLGFIAVKYTEEVLRFLDWWGRLCGEEGFEDAREGPYVDQKWINLAPTLFSGIKILRSKGLNVGYWNLHERELSVERTQLVVNKKEALIFFHFSGIDVLDKDSISKHLPNVKLSDRPDLIGIFSRYREELNANEYCRWKSRPYGFAAFNNGEPINSVTRKVFSLMVPKIDNEQVFDIASNAYRKFSSLGLVGKRVSGKNVGGAAEATKRSVAIKWMDRCMWAIFRILGPHRYALFLKYLSKRISIRNQRTVFFDN